MTCVCGGGIFLLLAQNLISILRKMHTGTLYLSHKTGLVMQSLPMRADQTVRAPTPSILIEEAALSLSEQPAFVGVDQIKAAQSTPFVGFLWIELSHLDFPITN